MKRVKADNYFHAKPENLNCAQSILKAFQAELNIPESIVSEFKAWGGGRAPEGICGALYAADFLLKQHNKNSIKEEFKEKACGITCRELKKENKTPCIVCVKIADELLEQKLMQK